MGEDGAANVSVIVTADSEDNQTFTWQENVTRTCTLKKVAKSWAAAHGVPETAVGFEDPHGYELDLKKTLIQHNLVGSKDTTAVVRLVAFPLSDEYAESEDKAADVRDVEAPSRQRKSASNAPIPPVPPPAAQPPAEAQAQPAKRERSEEAVDVPAAKAAKAAKKPDPPAPAEAPESEGAAAETTPAKAPPAPKGKEATRQTKSAAKESPPKSPATDPKGKAKAKPPAAEQAAAASKAKPAGNDGPIPRDDDPIVYLQESPKRPGTNAFERYEKYKTAKTPNEALALGAMKADIGHDFKHGYMRRA